MVLGSSVKIYKDGVLIACSRTNSIDHNCDTIPYSSPATSQSKQYMAGEKDWLIEVSWLATSIHIPLAAILTVRNTFTVKFGSSSSLGVGGSAILKSCNIVANTGQLLTGSFVFQGTGDLSDD